MPTIGLYMPKWLYKLEPSDRLFFDDLLETIKQSGLYRPLVLDLEALHLSSTEEAELFCKKHTLIAIVQHHSHFYSKSQAYAHNIELLNGRVRLINSEESHRIGADKLETNTVLQAAGIPIVEGAVANTVEELLSLLEDGVRYVIKPHNGGAGAGVKLIKKVGEQVCAYKNSKWQVLRITAKSGGIKIRYTNAYQYLIESAYTYNPVIIEPFFNDEDGVFTSLRCTVIGNQVVESVQRVNSKNITSNISSGGVATAIELSEYQQSIAVAASKAIGADYAGVDLLVRSGESVVGEVNIGPFTLFTTYTGVRVGKLFGEYLLKIILQ